MLYALAVVLLVAVVAVHELVLRAAVRRLSRVAGIAVAAAASYLAIAAIGFGMVASYGVATGRTYDVVDDTLQGYDAQGKLESGDRIVAVGGYEIDGAHSLIDIVETAAGAPLVVKVLRDGSPVEVSIRPTRVDGHWVLGFKRARVFEVERDLAAAGGRGLEMPVLRAVALGRAMFPEPPADPGGPKRMIVEYDTRASSSGLATRLLIDANLIVALLQIIADAVRLRRRRQPSTSTVPTTLDAPS